MHPLCLSFTWALRLLALFPFISCQPPIHTGDVTKLEKHLYQNYLKAIKLPDCSLDTPQSRELWQVDVKDGFPLFLKECAEIGEGVFGTVYSAKNVFTNEIVAVKAFHDYEPGAQQRIVDREFHHVERLNQSLGRFQLGEREAMVIPFVRGIPLSDILKAGITNSGFRETYRRVAQVIAKLLRHEGFAHRDLHHNNILVSKMSYDPRFKCYIPDDMTAIDFGCGYFVNIKEDITKEVLQIINPILSAFMTNAYENIHMSIHFNELIQMMYLEVKEGCPECNLSPSPVFPSPCVIMPS